MENKYVYRIYIASENEGYELQKITQNEAIIEKYRGMCNECEWFVKMFVVRHNIPLNMDEPYLLEFFYGNGKSYDFGGKNNK